MDVLYGITEIMIATGLSRATIANRAKRLGFERTGKGYTYSQVVKIVTVGASRADKQKAIELRGMLNNTFAEECWPLKISVTHNTAKLEQYDASKYLKDTTED